MEKAYHPHEIEQKTYKHWEKNGYFKPHGTDQSYCIMLPPPNVTGSLHMGHGFCFSLMDILIRYQRMQGKQTLWQPGTDHAGIATQMVVERQLLKQGQTREALGRDAFLQKIWDWKQRSGGQITQQLRRLGASLDWSHECFSMDESLSHTVRDVFIRLYNEGLIYRGTRLVNWDPKLLTAISDLEVVHQEEEGYLWHIRYPLINPTTHTIGFLIVATTRPETLLGDVAIAVHPHDPRYPHLIGQSVRLPLTDRVLPIIADESVDQTFGSGCVKITPAHDFNDYATGQRHQLRSINIFTPNAHLNDAVPPPYQGLERFVAREKIIADLTALNLIEKIERHRLNIPYGDRSGVVIEPYLTPQWFMKMETLAQPAINAVKTGQVSFIPDNWSKTYFQWLENIQDWCISRQLWWGHRIPAWYDKHHTIYVGKDEKDIRTRYQLADDVSLQQDQDVLDTWFSSALWPFSTLGWPEKNTRFETFYPNQVLITGFDIIFFWVARMMMMGIKLTGQVPFKEIFITGLVRDANGQKMSKTKGNVLDPLDLIDGITVDALVEKRIHGLMQPRMAAEIEKITRQQYPTGIAAYGTDALRFTFCALASYGREVRFDIPRLQGYRNFCNKLWNATRYVLMNIPDKTASFVDNPQSLSLSDEWILSRLQRTIQTAHQALKEYRFDLLAQHLYQLTWNEFCDWYLELSKPILTSPDSTPAELYSTRYILIFILENILRLLHPIMPFITEEIWQRIAPLAGKSGETIMLQPYPVYDANLIHAQQEMELEWVKAIIIAIRTLRSENTISPATLLNVVFYQGTESDYSRYQVHQHRIKKLAKLASCEWVKNDQSWFPPIKASIKTWVGECEIGILTDGLMDKTQKEAQRTREKIKQAKLIAEKEMLENKLKNPNFFEKAPAHIVAKEKERLDALLKEIKYKSNKMEYIPSESSKSSDNIAHLTNIQKKCTR